MPDNLLKEGWTRLGSYELRLLLDKCIGGPGQYDVGQSEKPQRFYLPVARDGCKVALTFQGSEIIAIQPGEAFDAPGFIRLSYATSMETLREGSARLLEFVASRCGVRH